MWVFWCGFEFLICILKKLPTLPSAGFFSPVHVVRFPSLSSSWFFNRTWRQMLPSGSVLFFDARWRWSWIQSFFLEKEMRRRRIVPGLQDEQGNHCSPSSHLVPGSTQFQKSSSVNWKLRLILIAPFSAMFQLIPLDLILHCRFLSVIFMCENHFDYCYSGQCWFHYVGFVFGGDKYLVQRLRVEKVVVLCKCGCECGFNVQRGRAKMHQKSNKNWKKQSQELPQCRLWMACSFGPTQKKTKMEKKIIKSWKKD